MLGKRIPAALILALLIALAAVLQFTLRNTNPFDLEALKAASVNEDALSLAVSATDPAEYVCVLGPYMQKDLFTDPDHADLIAQLSGGPVEEHVVRIALFDDKEQLIREYDVPFVQNGLRVEASETYCSSARDVIVSPAVNGDTVSLRIVRITN